MALTFAGSCGERKVGFAMKSVVVIGFVVVAAILAGCSDKQRCGRGDWCACSDGNACNQGCDDVDGCRIFCYNMNRCGATCGTDCSLEFHDAVNSSLSCGDRCHFTCHDGTSCEAHGGASSDFTCFNLDSCAMEVGANSKVSCTSVTSCTIACLGDCHVNCADEVTGCEVTCKDGAAPVSCSDGSRVCGSC